MRRVQLLLLILVFLFFSIAQSLMAVSTNKTRTNFAYANGTNVTVTVTILTCKGERIDPGYVKYLSFETKGTNVTRSIEGRDSFNVTLPAGNYSIIVKYLDTTVYRSSLSLVNSTSLTIRANITRVLFRAIGLSSQGVPGYLLSVGPFTLNSGSSDTVSVWLPFGTAQYAFTYTWNTYGNASVSGTVQVSCSTDSVIVRLPVWSILVFNFRLSDGSSVLGLDGYAELYYSGQRINKLDFQSQDSLRVQGALTGLYTAKVFLHGKKIGETTITVDDKNWEYTVSVNVIRSLTVRLRDMNNQPLTSQDLTASLITPLGTTLNYSLADSSVLTVPQTIAGEYSLKVISSLIGTIYEGKLRVSSDSVDVQLPLLYASLVFKPEGSSTIPRGVSVKVFFSYADRDILLWTTSSLSDGSETTKRVSIGVLPVGSTIRVEVQYAGLKYTSFLSIGGTGIAQISLPLYDVIIKVFDKNGNPLNSCTVNLTAGNIILNSQLKDGEVFFSDVPKTDARLAIVCSGLVVIDRVVAVTSGNITLTAPLTSLKVVVKSWFDRPVVGAKVTLSVLAGNKTVYSLSDVTDQSGGVVLNSVPVFSGGYLMLRVDYGPYVYTQRLKGDEALVPVFLDVLLDTPFIKLSLIQVAFLVAGIIVLGFFLVIFLKKYAHVSALKSMFEVGAGEEEEKESITEKLKKVFQRKKEEEEEEESIFF